MQTLNLEMIGPDGIQNVTVRDLVIDGHTFAIGKRKPTPTQEAFIVMDKMTGVFLRSDKAEKLLEAEFRAAVDRIGLASYKRKIAEYLEKNAAKFADLRIERTPEEIIARINELPKPGLGYTYEYVSQAAEEFIGRTEELVLAMNGYRLIVKHMGPVLVSITPRASSVSGGKFQIAPQPAIRNPFPFMGQNYFWEYNGPQKLREAVRLTLLAWQDAKGIVSEVYKAVGKSGYCAICGAFLTDEQSTTRGIGPECWKKIGVGLETALEIQRLRKTDPTRFWGRNNDGSKVTKPKGKKRS